MDRSDDGQIRFICELADYQISAQEFFSRVLLESLERHFGYRNAVILYFDADNHFLSWTCPDSTMMNGEKHPYAHFLPRDPVRRTVYEAAVREKLTYFDVKPRLFRSTDLIDEKGYAASEYVRFIEKNFGARYSVSCGYGVNAYIQVVLFKSEAEGDFTEAEMQELNSVSSYVASAYKNYKRYERSKILSNIQSEIIDAGEKAYFIVDDLMHIVAYNAEALTRLERIVGREAVCQAKSGQACVWLPFLLGDDSPAPDETRICVVQDAVFKIKAYEKRYSNGIVERHHWIAISDKAEEEMALHPASQPLTQAEQRVAELMHKGLTYQAIADELIISYHTVKNHVQNIYSKCGVNSRYQLYQWMEKNKIT